MIILQIRKPICVEKHPCIYSVSLVSCEYDYLFNIWLWTISLWQVLKQLFYLNTYISLYILIILQNKCFSRTRRLSCTGLWSVFVVARCFVLDKYEAAAMSIKSYIFVYVPNLLHFSVFIKNKNKHFKFIH